MDIDYGYKHPQLPPYYKVEVTQSSDPILVECSKDYPLVAYAVDSSIFVLEVKYEEINYEDYDQYPSYVDNFSDRFKIDWASQYFETGKILSINFLPNYLNPSGNEPHSTLCSSGFNGSLSMYVKKDDEHENIPFEGHKNHVNSCCFFGDQEKLLIASTGDDAQCKIWDVKTKSEFLSLPLKSAGMAVKTHAENPWLVLVAEKCGDIKIYDIRSRSVAFNCLLDDPLLAVDWNPHNIEQIGATCGNRWYIWKCDNPSDNKQGMHEGFNITDIKWSNFSKDIYATIEGRDSIKIWNEFKQSEIKKLQLSRNFSATSGNISWLYNYPIIITGSNKCLQFFIV